MKLLWGLLGVVQPHIGNFQATGSLFQEHIPRIVETKAGLGYEGGISPWFPHKPCKPDLEAPTSVPHSLKIALFLVSQKAK